ncbi:MAG: Stp1/IreP family PP2C-type Ser/Thr phosphatase [bacterium]|nr:Stp1/IreP family PP2C-type Ser/Thr phosphatase [bacterium]
MKSFSVTDIGLKRTVNQDYVFSSEQEIGKLPNLFIVADGMGGHNAGDFASKYCVQSVIEYIKNSDDVTTISILNGAIKYANKMLRQKASEDETLEGMGTTMVAASVYGKRMLVANIGDSRLYVLNDQIKQITKDHSLVEIMVESGEINAEDARFHPNKNVVTRAIGGIDDSACADFFEVDLNEGDIVLLCSDGLSNMLGDDEILQTVNELSGNLEETGKTLIKKANDHGGKDNIAIILMKV